MTGLLIADARPGDIQRLGERLAAGRYAYRVDPAMDAACRAGLGCRTGWLGAEIVAAAGLAWIGAGRGKAWALLDPAIPRMAFRPILRAMRAELAACDARGFRRIECEVDMRFAVAQRFAQHLGFIIEGPCFAGGPDGADLIHYARVPGLERARSSQAWVA